LTPVLTITSQANSYEQQQRDEGAQLSWDSILLTEAGCAAMDLSTSPAFLQGKKVQIQAIGTSPAPSLQLFVKGAVEGSIPASVVIGLKQQKEQMTGNDSDEALEFETLVLQSSVGASFERGACQGQRVTVVHGRETQKLQHEPIQWPSLTIHKDMDITVWAIYERNGVLYRIEPPLQLEWIPPIPLSADDKKPQASPDEDPQNPVDRQARHGLTILEQIERERDRELEEKKKKKKAKGGIDRKKPKSRRSEGIDFPNERSSGGGGADHDPLFQSFSARAHVWGMGIVICVNVVLVQVMLVFSRRRRSNTNSSKGLHDL
jgi:hypothetical protein